AFIGRSRCIEDRCGGDIVDDDRGLVVVKAAVLVEDAAEDRVTAVVVCPSPQAMVTLCVSRRSAAGNGPGSVRGRFSFVVWWWGWIVGARLLTVTLTVSGVAGPSPSVTLKMTA